MCACAQGGDGSAQRATMLMLERIMDRLGMLESSIAELREEQQDAAVARGTPRSSIMGDDAAAVPVTDGALR